MTQKRIIVIGGAGPVTAAMLAQLMQHEHPEIHFLAMSEEDLLRKAKQENPFRDPPDDVKEVLARLERKMPREPAPPAAPHPEPQYVKANKKRPKPNVPKPRDQASRGRHKNFKKMGRGQNHNGKGRRR